MSTTPVHGRPPGALKRTTLYALGSNGNFQLGLPHNEDVDVPQKCIFNIRPPSGDSAPDPLSPPAIGSAEAPSIPLHDPPNGTRTSLDVPLCPEETIASLTTGGNHTLILTTHGRVFAAGLNDHGQLCLKAPSDPPFPSTSTSTSATTSPVPQTEPRHQSDLTPGFHRLPWTGPAPDTPITHISATFTVTLVVASHTTLYTAGYGPKGELALGRAVPVSTAPTCAFDIREAEGPASRIDSLVACVDHALILSSTGVVYAWGAARKGQVGETLRASSAAGGGGCCWAVSRTEICLAAGLSFRPRQVVTGRTFTVALADDARQAAWFGKLSDFTTGSRDLSMSEPDEQDEKGGDTKDPGSSSQRDQTQVQNNIRIQAGWSSLTLHHTRRGTLRGLGRSTHGQHPPPRAGGRVVALAVGSEHSVALLADGRVVSWGWGEHGNCGRDVDARGVVHEGWNVLFEPAAGEAVEGPVTRAVEKGEGSCEDAVVVRGIGAGCASSFFWVEIQNRN